MDLKVFAVFDDAVKAFSQPFFARASGEATRIFQDSVNKEDHPFNKHPEHYTLFEIGTYDYESARLSSLDTPHSLGLALQYKEGVDDNIPN